MVSCFPQCSSDSKTSQDSLILEVLQQSPQRRNVGCHTTHKMDLSRNQYSFRTFRSMNTYNQDPVTMSQ